VAADRESYLSPSDDRATMDLVSVAGFQRIRVARRRHDALGVGDVTVVAGGVDITGVVCGMSGGVGPALRARPHVVRRSSKTSLAIH